MPFTVRKIGKRKWGIFRKDTGKRVGTSSSKRKAHISASIRQRKAHGK